MGTFEAEGGQPLAGGVSHGIDETQLRKHAD